MTISFVNYCLSKIIFSTSIFKELCLSKVIFHSYCNSNDVFKKGCSIITFYMIFLLPALLPSGNCRTS